NKIEKMYSLTDDDKRKLIYSIDEKNITEVDEKIIKFISDSEKRSIAPKPSKITISTCSYTGELNFIIDDYIKLNDILKKDMENNIEFIKNVNIDKKKNKITKRKYNPDFYNSICIDLRYNKSNIHIKIFLNGKITGTGCKSSDDLKFIDKFLEYLKNKKELI